MGIKSLRYMDIKYFMEDMEYIHYYGDIKYPINLPSKWKWDIKYPMKNIIMGIQGYPLRKNRLEWELND